ncbi:nucleotide-diphospho-sugar transferase [Xylaria intraflava]|nr:nucleotide-diphospho-sugar transferase [Xylaria intraflava]
MLPSSPLARRIVKFVIVALPIILLLNFVVSIYNFANLFAFFKPHSGTFVTQQEILDAFNAHNKTNAAPVATPIPKILHQVFHNWSDPDSTAVTLPDDWEGARQSCIALNPDWEYKLWTIKTSREFIEDEFPWFLDTYDSYKFPIQRVDVIRYFILRHFGGIYMDLDNGCKLSLEPITQFPAFTTFGGHGTLSNNILGGQPDHPLFHLLTGSLTSWNWNWILPYVIISYTSGQWFVTAMWEKYHSLLSARGTVSGFEGTGWAPLHYISMDTRPNAPEPFVFWTQEHGGTWDNWDSAWFGWLGNNIWLVIGRVVGGILVLILSVTGCVFYRRWSAGRRAAGYMKVESTVV